MSASEILAVPDGAATEILSMPEVAASDYTAVPDGAVVEMPAAPAGAAATGAATRRAKRLRPPMHCYWGTTEACPRNGRITSLGVGGCFVKTKAEATEGQEIFVNCWLPTERWLMLRGRITYRLARVGFGVSFTGLTAGEREILSALLDYLDEAQG